MNLIGDDDVRHDDVDGQTDGRDIFAMRCDLSILGVEVMRDNKCQVVNMDKAQD